MVLLLAIAGTPRRAGMDEAGAGDGDSITNAEDLLAFLTALPGCGVVTQEAANAFTCVKLGEEWQKARRAVVGACACAFQYDKKVAEGKHKLTAKLRAMGLLLGGGSAAEEELEFGFHFPLSPSGYHISLKPPDPAKAKSAMQGREVHFVADKVFLQAANYGDPNMFDPTFYVATWVQVRPCLQSVTVVRWWCRFHVGNNSPQGRQQGGW